MELLWLLAFFFCLDISEQALTIKNSHWKLTPLSYLNVKFVNEKAVYGNSSIVSCASKCLRDDPCFSFSFHAPTKTCYVFSGRVSFGLNMTRAPQGGYRHYWKIYRDCPTSLGYVYNVTSNVCYKGVANVATRLPWLDARQACENEGAHLFIANTPAKLDVVYRFITDNAYQTLQFKLGGDDIFEEGWFLWLDGSPVTTWYIGQPDNGPTTAQNCMENTRSHPDFNSDGICETADRYICQWPLD